MTFYQFFCPICKKPTTWKDNPKRPFCSDRCRQIDLGKWVFEGYRIPDRGDAEDETPPDFLDSEE